MAIKEFIIGPQNYFEEGYFDGDYTQPNVSKSFLECDIDNIKGGRVVTGLYYEDDYIDGTYWHDNSIRATLTAEILVVQEASVSLQGYYNEGYYDAGYYEERGSVFVLSATLEKVGVIAEASATLESSSNFIANAGKQVDVDATLSVEFNQTASPQKLKETILFAFNEAAIAIQINVLADANIELSTQFNVATDVSRIRNIDSSEDAIFDIDVINERSRAFDINTQTAFSFIVTEDRFRLTTADLTSTATLTATISHIEGADIVIEGFGTLSCQIDDRTRSMSSAMSAVIETTIDNSRIRDIPTSASFAGFQTCDNQRIRFGVATLDAISSITIDAEGYKGVGNTTLTSLFNISISAYVAQADPGPVLTIKPYHLYHFDQFQQIDSIPTYKTFDAYNANLGIIGTPNYTDIKFGSGSFDSPQAITAGAIGATLQTNVSGATDFTVDLWFYYVNPSGTPAGYGRIIGIPNQDSTAVLYEIRTNTLNGAVLLINGAYASGFSLANAWEHLVLQRRGTELSIWKNGVKISDHTVTRDAIGSYWGFDSVKSTTTNTWYSSRGYIDELRIRPEAGYTTTFTPPTSAYPLEYSVYNEKNGYAVLDTTSIINVSALIIQFGEASLTATATQSVIDERIRFNSADLSAQFARLFIVTELSDLDAELSVQSTMVTDGRILRLANSDITSEFTQSITETRVRYSNTALTSASTLTAEVVIITAGSTNLTTTASMSIDANRIRGLEPQLDSIATQLTVAFINATGTVLLEAISQLSATAETQAFGVIELQSTATATVSAVKTTDTAITIESQFEQIASNDKIRAVEITMQSQADIAVTTANLIQATSNITTTASLEIDTDRVRDIISLEVSSATLICDNQIILEYQSNQTAVATVFASPNFVIRISTNLTAFNAVLALGDVINIDPCRTIRVPEETRIAKILPERRIITVEQETRINIIKCEERR
jgi:hypothetical protein